ncbi:ligand-gated ion channel [Lithospermum erythrorhizon]|uniref:Ligand-gated ion channel n=1 Tax=Lithospermum erythrorhizon TaxID=34254 RepID=A0AAV3PQD8_LITER
MDYSNTKSVSFPDDPKSEMVLSVCEDTSVKAIYKINGSQLSEPSSRRGKESRKTDKRVTLKAKVISRVFSEDFERAKRKILDPREPLIYRWNTIFLVACLVSLFTDPLFFYLPVVHKSTCIHLSIPLEVGLSIIRSIADVFYIIQIFVRFRTAYIAPSSRVFGRGELVIDSNKIAMRYLRKGFGVDFLAALPLPQVLIWFIIPNLGGSTVANTRNVLRFLIIFQYLPRLYLIFQLTSEIVKATGVVTEKAWAGAAYNLILYMLASHVIGACWYLLSIERQEACWKHVCGLEKLSCQYSFFDCHKIDDNGRNMWLEGSNITTICDPDQDSYPYGIYGDAAKYTVTSANFFNKYLYCLWWGLKNLSSLGQGLSTTTYVGENMFAIIVVTLGLVLFGLLIGNMQTYLQSTTVRLEEWRIRRTDSEQWMHHRQLPHELRQSVRKYDQYKWMATHGVDEESLLRELPLDLRRDIKRHLCYDLVRRVPLFDQMDESMLDAICERLKPALCTEGTCIIREGDPVNEMLFIIRGNLDSYTTNGGRTGFFNSINIGPSDFCGEELLTWALDPRPSVILPSSTRSVKATSEVEAFALSSEDLKFVAAQFRRLHSKQLRHKFRFYSHQWRTWAACFIQAAWLRYKKRRNAAELKDEVDASMKGGSETLNGESNVNSTSPSRSPSFSVNAPSPSRSPGFSTSATRLAASRIGTHKNSESDSSTVNSIQKPTEPDFSVDDE